MLFWGQRNNLSRNFPRWLVQINVVDVNSSWRTIRLFVVFIHNYIIRQTTLLFVQGTAYMIPVCWNGLRPVSSQENYPWIGTDKKMFLCLVSSWLELMTLTRRKMFLSVPIQSTDNFPEWKLAFRRRHRCREDLLVELRRRLLLLEQSFVYNYTIITRKIMQFCWVVHRDLFQYIKIIPFRPSKASSDINSLQVSRRIIVLMYKSEYYIVTRC
jgi:hypothetical protein